MEMEFGNWMVNQNSISWKGEEWQVLEVEKEALTTVRYDSKGSFLYDWILKITEFSWLTQDDLYDFNFAFVYACAKWDLEFSYPTFDATLAEQYEQLDEEEDDDD